jgi:VWFA-related protein
MARAASVVCCFLYAVGLALAQTLPAAQNAGGPPTVTIQTNARIVLLDLLVKDKVGRPVHGLKADDFIVLEDGKGQQLKAFEEHGADGQNSSKPVSLNLPPNTYTNFVSSGEPGAVNIILFDLLNTDRMSLTRARQELLSYLKKLPNGSRIALFTLDDQLHLVHGFTDDTQALASAAQQLSSSPNPMLRNSRDVAEELTQARMAKLGSNPKMYAALSSFLWNEYESKVKSRTLVTMEALNQLARSMAVFPGRKNLIWISGGVPFDPVETTPQMQKTAALLSATEITVYPIDVRGNAYLGANGASLSPDVFGPRGGDYSTATGQAREVYRVQETMLNMARLTGGQAYFNSNDMPGQIQDVVESNSRYYALAYRPDNQDWNGAFRKVTVKTLQPRLKVQCRPGYYAVADPFGTSDLDRTFSLAMQPEVPPSTALIIQARVLPPDAPDKPVQVDFLIDMHDLKLLQSADRRVQPNLMFVSAAWDKEGKPQGNVVGNYQQILQPAEMQALMNSGLRLQQQLQLKPGEYQLKVGVVDRLSGKIGTIDVPLAIQSKVAGK